MPDTPLQQRLDPSAVPMQAAGPFALSAIRQPLLVSRARSERLQDNSWHGKGLASCGGHCEIWASNRIRIIHGVHLEFGSKPKYAHVQVPLCLVDMCRDGSLFSAEIKIKPPFWEGPPHPDREVPNRLTTNLAHCHGLSSGREWPY